MRLGICGHCKGVVLCGPENDKWRPELSFDGGFSAMVEGDLLGGIDISGIILIINEHFHFFLTKGKGGGYNTQVLYIVFFLKKKI